MDNKEIAKKLIEGTDVAARLRGDISEVPAEITTKDGLLYRNGVPINLPEADKVARQYGYLYAERLVKALADAGRLLK